MTTARTALSLHGPHHASRRSRTTTPRPDPEAINWGHVGDITETRRQLQEIADRLFGEGEYAAG